MSRRLTYLIQAHWSHSAQSSGPLQQFSASPPCGLQCRQVAVRDAGDDCDLLRSSSCPHMTQLIRVRAPALPPSPAGGEMQRVYTVYFYTKYCRHAAPRKRGSTPAPTTAAVAAATKGRWPFAFGEKKSTKSPVLRLRKAIFRRISLTNVHRWTLIKQRDMR